MLQNVVIPFILLGVIAVGIGWVLGWWDVMDLSPSHRAKKRKADKPKPKPAPVLATSGSGITATMPIAAAASVSGNWTTMISVSTSSNAPAPKPSLSLPEETVIGHVLGWRAYDVSADWTLVSVGRGTADPNAGRNPPLVVMDAVCVKDGRADMAQHPAPDENCSCGIYAYPTLEEFRKHYNRGGNRSGAGTIYGLEALVRLRMWGKLVRHTQGWRAQYAYPDAIFLGPVFDGLGDPEYIIRAMQKQWRAPCYSMKSIDEMKDYEVDFPILHPTIAGGLLDWTH